MSRNAFYYYSSENGGRKVFEVLRQWQLQRICEKSADMFVS